MGVSKVVLADGTNLLDLTQTTVSKDTLAKGATAVDKTGTMITGEMESLDTSDATAKSTDIVYLESAYVNGSKVIGSLKKSNGTTGTGMVYYNTYVDDAALNNSNSSGLWQLSATVSERCYLESGLFFMPIGDSNYFGSAASSDVLSGATFTSSAGLKTEGTLVVQRYYTGSTEPAGAADGDLWLKV